MAKVIDFVVKRYEAVYDAVTDQIGAFRARWRWLDHLGRAVERYQEKFGNRLAAAVSFYGFLSFFPLTALAFSLVGYAVVIDKDARQHVEDAIAEILPGLVDQLPVDRIASARQGAGIIALAVLLWAGLGWVSNLRGALRDIWNLDPGGGGNFFVKKFWDLIVLISLGTALLVSVGVSSFATSATYVMLGWLGQESTSSATLLVKAGSLVVALITDMIIFFVMFSRLSGTRARWNRLVKGAGFGAIGLETLKLTGTYLIAHTTSNPIYASFAVMIGLLVWINLVTRWILLAAAWTATRSKVLAADDQILQEAEKTEQAEEAKEVEQAQKAEQAAETPEPKTQPTRSQADTSA